MIKKLKRGQYYKTRGGWIAVCIWVNANDLHKGGYCIHKPGQDLPKLPDTGTISIIPFDEVGPIYHWGDGTAHITFAVFEPPTYDVGHPADLIREIQAPTPPQKEPESIEKPKVKP